MRRELIIAIQEGVECVYWTEPMAMCRQCKNQPNEYNMYSDLEGILARILKHSVEAEKSTFQGELSFQR
jgi:hypothetical protein